MRFHLLGVGSIGTLLAHHLALLPSAPAVRLLVRRKKHLASLLVPGLNQYGRLSLERDGALQTLSRYELELVNQNLPSSSALLPPGSSPMQRTRDDGAAFHAAFARTDHIDTLIVTTKAQATVPALLPLVHRLDEASTVVLCQNGMGMLERLLHEYWPNGAAAAAGRGRPSFVCATTAHGVFRRSDTHFVHAGQGALNFAALPNAAVTSAIRAALPQQPGGNPLLDLGLGAGSVQPSLDHLPLTPATASLHGTLSALSSLTALQPNWLALPAFKLLQLEKLAINAAINPLTSILDVRNGDLLDSSYACRAIRDVAGECAAVFAAYLANTGTALASDWETDEEHQQTADWNGPPSPSPRLSRSHRLSAAALELSILRVCAATASNTSSMLSDLRRIRTSSTGAPQPHARTNTEIDFINGYVVGLGKAYGRVPHKTAMLAQMVKAREEVLRSTARREARDAGADRKRLRRPRSVERPVSPVNEAEEEPWKLSHVRARKQEERRAGWAREGAERRRERRNSH